MRMTDAILPGSPPRDNIKGSADNLLPFSRFPTGQQQERPSTWESTFTLLHWLSLTYFEQSAKHHEESTSSLCTLGVWEIILSSYIFPSKPTDPQRNKLDIFNSCFDSSIFIPVPTIASQLLLWLWHFNSCPDDSISTPALTSTS